MSVTAAGGFLATGLACGVKPADVPDLALIFTWAPVPAAAVFTTSTTAAPVIEMGRQALSDGRLQAVVVVSGCANAVAGAAGAAAAERVVKKAADLLGIDEANVLLSTTGPIGKLLPVLEVYEGLERAFPALGDGSDDGRAAASGILTTDTVAKEAVVEGDGYVVGGMAKGSGMVRPDMATMLAYLTTDAVVHPEVLRSSLREAVAPTFNSLNIDGCQSTNDTVVVMASGASGVEPDPESFTADLTGACRSLAMQMMRDAEGASRVVTLRIVGATDDAAAREIGKAVADSARVRTSFYKEDPNWGRLAAAAGVSGHEVSPFHIGVRYGQTTLAWHGIPMAHSVEGVSKQMAGDFSIEMRVGLGLGKATILTCDLTPEYAILDGGMRV
jgi:glutamate N-acetyltransferase/amino-acid N-acetyltransferase